MRNVPPPRHSYTAQSGNALWDPPITTDAGTEAAEICRPPVAHGIFYASANVVRQTLNKDACWQQPLKRVTPTAWRKGRNARPLPFCPLDLQLRRLAFDPTPRQSAR